MAMPVQPGQRSQKDKNHVQAILFLAKERPNGLIQAQVGLGATTEGKWMPCNPHACPNGKANRGVQGGLLDRGQLGSLLLVLPKRWHHVAIGRGWPTSLPGEVRLVVPVNLQLRPFD